MEGKVVSNVYVRSAPTTASKLLRTLYAGTQVKIISVSTEANGSTWAKMDVWKGPKETDYYKNVYSEIKSPTGKVYIQLSGDSTNTGTTAGSNVAGALKLDEGDILANAKGIDASMEGFMAYVNGSSTAFKGTLKLFGSPFQFREEVDYRVPNVSNILGRTYIENISVDAPIVTIIPGKPDFLPNAKHKKATGSALIAAAGGAFTELSKTELQDTELRYFDFKSDYLEYIKYVNMLCRSAAGFLELTNYEFMGTKLGSFDWASYRYDQSKYKSAVGTLASGVGGMLGGALKDVASGITNLLGGSSGANGGVLTGDKAESSYQDVIEQLFVNMNFVQFYTDPSVGKSESASNATSQSLIDSKLQSVSDLTKELQFLANSGGINAQQLQEGVGESLNNIASMMPGDGAISGFLSRILNLGGTVVQGDNLILPEIYQRSEWSESYSVTIVLKTPYMDKLSYYLNLVVPLMHLLALILPKQSSANTYSCPFLIKGFIPGVWTCSMGIVDSISVEKNSGGDAMSIDGFPSEIKVSLSIKDLYSALSISSSADPKKFLANTSLIDYLGVTAGVDLTKPNIQKRVLMYVDSLLESIGDIPDNAAALVTEKVQHTMEQFFKIGS